MAEVLSIATQVQAAEAASDELSAARAQYAKAKSFIENVGVLLSLTHPTEGAVDASHPIWAELAQHTLSFAAMWGWRHVTVRLTDFCVAAQVPLPPLLLHSAVLSKVGFRV